MNLKDIEEVPIPYRDIFKNYPCFNRVQSEVFEDILYSDKSLVVSAPTGSGKTVIFELAIIKILSEFTQGIIDSNFKVIYICPMKSLCEERLVDWHNKLAPFGINCISVTGDSDYNLDFQTLLNHNLIMSTPEKWDSLTRTWRNNEKIVKIVKLFLIDEVHLLNEENRGSTLEVIVSRMKTIQRRYGLLQNKIRFIAVSATIPNVEDIAEWIGDSKSYKFSEELRPVKLQKIVFGYPMAKNRSHFLFELSLNYKLPLLIKQYSEGKPTLIFCSTRKSVELTAQHLIQSFQIDYTVVQRQRLNIIASSITDSKVKTLIKHGICYHHAGLIPETRHAIEEAFRSGDLPVLVTTRTLSMGVNLPAHLVIIKSTKCYDSGSFQNYSEIDIQQMIGRAGRPQFDKSATALILTTNEDKLKFELMMEYNQPLESNLHRHLIEHLNAEVVLRTITDLDVAMQWLASTFLYVRARKNPRHYGLPVGISIEQIDKKLLEIFQIDLNKLVKAGMLILDENINITPTATGNIMAHYYVAFESMKLFTQLSGTEVLVQILAVIATSHNFSELRIRTTDKKYLNLLNKKAKTNTIRFPLKGRITTADMKINCLIQAVFGNLEILDHSLQTESWMLMRHGERITKCLVEYLASRKINCYTALLNSIILAKCFRAKIWEDSPFVCKQLSKIGSVLSHQLVNAGKTSFEKILMSNPRDIELIIKKRPPTGDMLIDEVQHLPKFNLSLNRSSSASEEYLEVEISINLLNLNDLSEKSTLRLKSAMILLVGTSYNEILLYERYQISYIMDKPKLTRFVKTKKDTTGQLEVEAHLISEDWVGIDCSTTLFGIENNKKGKVTEDKKKQVQKNKSEKTYMQLFLDMYKMIKTKSKENIETTKKNDFCSVQHFNKNKTLSSCTNKTTHNPIQNVKNNANKNFKKIHNTNQSLISVFNNEQSTFQNNTISQNNYSEDLLHDKKSKYTQPLSKSTDLVNLTSISKDSLLPLSQEILQNTTNDSIDITENEGNVNHVKIVKEQEISNLTSNEDEVDINDEAHFNVFKNAVNGDLEYHCNQSDVIIDQHGPTKNNICETENLFKECKNRKGESFESLEVLNFLEENDEKDSESNCENNKSQEHLNEPAEVQETILNYHDFVTQAPSTFTVSQKYLPSNTSSPAGKSSSKSLVAQRYLPDNISSVFTPISCSNKSRKRKIDELALKVNLEDTIHEQQRNPRPLKEMFQMEETKHFSHNSNRDQHVNSSYSRAGNKLYVLTELQEPPSKQKLNECNKEQQKTIKWRSPLVFSPAVKFSPKIQCRNVILSENNIDGTSYEESLDTLESNCSKNNSKFNLHIQKTRKELKPNQNPFSKHSKPPATKFLLRDNDYNKVRSTATDNNTKLKESEKIDKLSDLCSTTFLEDLGFVKNRTEYKQKEPIEHLTQCMPKSNKQNDKREHMRDTSQQAENKENINTAECDLNLTSISQRLNANSFYNLHENNIPLEYSHITGNNQKYMEDFKNQDAILSQNKTIVYDSGRVVPYEYIDPYIRPNYNYTNAEKQKCFNTSQDIHLNKTFNYRPLHPHPIEAPFDSIPPNSRINPYYSMNPMIPPYQLTGYDQNQPIRSSSYPADVNRSRYFPREHCPEDYQFSLERNILHNQVNSSNEFQSRVPTTLKTPRRSQVESFERHSQFRKEIQNQNFNLTNLKSCSQSVKSQPRSTNNSVINENSQRRLVQNSRNFPNSEINDKDDYNQYEKNNYAFGEFDDNKISEPVYQNSSLLCTPSRERHLEPHNYYGRPQSFVNSEFNNSIVARNPHLPPTNDYYYASRYPSAFRRPFNNPDYHNRNFTYPFMEDFNPNYGVPAEYCDYMPLKSHNDKEYVMNKFFYSLNQD